MKPPENTTISTSVRPITSNTVRSIISNTTRSIISNTVVACRMKPQASKRDKCHKLVQDWPNEPSGFLDSDHYTEYSILLCGVNCATLVAVSVAVPPSMQRSLLVQPRMRPMNPFVLVTCSSHHNAA